jgi:hypothetical protein
MIQKWIPSFFRLAIRMVSVDRAEVRYTLQSFMEGIAQRYVDPKSEMDMRSGDAKNRNV